MTYASAAPGWYADPAAPHQLRWFDGTAWTSHTTPIPTYAGPAPGHSPYAGSAYAGSAYAGSPHTGIGTAPSDPVHWLVPTGRTWESIAAGYLGLVTVFLFFLGPVTLAFGLYALRATSRSAQRGRGRAGFAVVVGAITSVLTAWALVAWVA
jgi:hypothetical protein